MSDLTVVRAELTAAHSLLNGIDYDEDSRVDRAVTAIENALDALDRAQQNEGWIREPDGTVRPALEIVEGQP